MAKVTYNRQLICWEDIEFGTGTVEQTRNGNLITLTQINAGLLPFNEEKNLQEVVDEIVASEANVVNLEESATSAASAASISETNALASEDKAEKWAEEDEDVEVEAGKYSSKHYSIKSQDSADASEISRQAAEALLDNFDDRYLGSFSVEPTVDNDGDPLQNGALYFNSTTKLLNVYDILTLSWVAIPVSSLASLTDITLTSLTTGQMLRWNGTVWENFSIIDDLIAGSDKTYSSDKVQALHDNQQTDINGLVQSVLNLQSSSAQGSFESTSTINLSTTEQVIPFTIKTQSTNTDIFEITNGTGIVKQAGTYSFISTVEFEDVGADGDVATITFNLRDTTTNDIYYTQSSTIEISNFDRETIPFNSLMTVPDTLTFPIEIDINIVCSQTGYNMVGFKSIVSSGGGDIMTIDTIDVGLGNKITESLI